MQTQSNLKPNALEVNHLTNGTAELVFNQNIEETKQPPAEEGQEEQTVYTYDSYTLTIDDRPNIEESVMQNYDAWLAMAREKEQTAKQQETTEQKVDRLERENAALQAQILNMI